MARIRTIKPEFFTSEDIVCLSPLARLLYIALWCEADKEGRLAWKPRTFKMRYLPADDCDAAALCAELLAAKLVILYGDGLALIPAFKAHQHINPRESASQLPEPPGEIAHVATRHSRVSDAQVGREGNEEYTHTALARDWKLSKPLGDWAVAEFPHWTAETVRTIAEQFHDHYTATGGVSADWAASWRKWCRDDLTQSAHKPITERKSVAVLSATIPSQDADKTQAYLREQAAAVVDPEKRRAAIALAKSALKGVAA